MKQRIYSGGQVLSRETASLVPSLQTLVLVACSPLQPVKPLIAVQANQGDPGVRCQTLRGTSTLLIDEPPRPKSNSRAARGARMIAKVFVAPLTAAVPEKSKICAPKSNSDPPECEASRMDDDP